MNIANFTQFIFAGCMAVAFSSCGVDPLIRHSEPTKFLTSTGSDISKRVERLPFEHSWRDPKVNISDYKNIVVRPVNMGFLRTEKWQESESRMISSKRVYSRRCAALGRYWTKSLRRSFSSPLCVFYQSTSEDQPKTLILEIALTEVRFDRNLSSAGGNAAGGLASAVTGASVCAFEARVRDAATGKLVSTAADRRGPDLSVDLSDKNRPAQANEKICDEWSDQLMKSSNIELFPKVRRRWFDFL